MDGFFEQIFGNAISEDRKLSIFTLPNKATQRFSDYAAAESYVAKLPDNLNVYYTLSLISGEPTGRGGYEHTSAIGCLWCDIDISSDSHKSKLLPATIDEAVDLLFTAPIKPSVLVKSGYGVHGYWLLDSPFVFSNESERETAQTTTKGWHQLICGLAATRGWKIENLGDLPRVLRVPGTFNNKVAGHPIKVEILCEEPLRHSIADFQRHIATEKPTKEPRELSYKAGRDSYERCLLYLDKIPGAIEGSSGGTQTLKACRAIFRFGLEGDKARQAFDHYNLGCDPPWTDEKEIAHKLTDARKIVDRDGEFGKWSNASHYETINDVDLTGIVGPRQPTQLITVPAIIDHDDDEFPEEESTEQIGQLPDSCLKPAGLLGDIIQFCLVSSRYPQPELALAASLALMGTITGRKVTDEFGTRTNIYILGLAESGTGKEHARQVNKELLIRAGGEALHGSERVGSHAGIVNAVFESPALLMQLDEIGRLLATMKDPKKAPHLYNCITVLMQLYSSSGTIWKADAYADSKKVKVINQPHLCIYGTATPDSFWHNLSTENIAEGLVGRLMVFDGRGYDVDMVKPALSEPPAEIVQAVRWWLDYRPNGGNLGTENPTPAVIKHSRAAEDRFMGHVSDINSRRKSEGKLRAALWSRSGEKVAKVALLHACSRTRMLPDLIELEDVEFAIRLANWVTRRILNGCVDHVSENDVEAKGKRILSIVGAKRMSLTELCRKTQWLRSRERSEILADLCGCGMLGSEQSLSHGGRPKTYLFRPKKKV